MVKPLKDLIAEADKFLGQTKTAAIISDEVSSFADSLIFATSIETDLQKTAKPSADLEFEKVAKALNKAAAEIEWEVIARAEQFEEAAKTQGYNDAQIDEALSKIAAAKVRKNLPALIELGYGEGAL